MTSELPAKLREQHGCTGSCTECQAERAEAADYIEKLEREIFALNERLTRHIPEGRLTLQHDGTWA